MSNSGFTFSNDQLDDILKKEDEKDRKYKIELFSRDYYGFWEFAKYEDSKLFTEDRKDMKLYAVILMLSFLGYIYNFACSMPRRRGKSYLVSRFLSFVIGMDPEKSNTRNSNAKKLSVKFSKHVRKFIQTKQYKKLFPKIKLETKDVEEWEITLAKQHTLISGGIDGGTTGSGTDGYLIGDDLIKGMTEATSPKYRNSLKDFLFGVYESGREQGSKRIETATRWIDNDPIGEAIETAKMLEQRVLIFNAFEERITDESIERFAKKIIKANLGNEEWVQLVIPALNKWDEATAEKPDTQKQLLFKRKKYKIKKMGFMWECIYQQNPTPKEGKLFPKDELKYFYYEDLEKERLSEILFIDPAGKGSNNTCGPFCKVKSDTEMYVTDMIYTPDEPKLSKPVCVKKIMEHKDFLGKISGEGNFGGDIYLEGIEDILVNNGVLVPLNIKSTTENKESKIFISSDIIKNVFRFPHEFDRNGNRQYEIDSPMDKAIKALTKYLGKVDGVFVTNQEDDIADALVGLLRMMSEPEKGFRVNFY